MCGAMNPIANAYCDQCNARIVPMTASPETEAEADQVAVKGVSLPTIPLEKRQAGEPSLKDGADDWLAQLRDSAVEQRPSEGLPTPDQAESEQAADDWLTQLRASTDGPTAAEPEATADLGGSVEMPEWLRDRGPIGLGAREEEPTAEGPSLPAEPAVQQPAPPTPTAAETADWLRDLVPQEGALPQAPPSTLGVEETIPGTPAPAPADIPDWLEDLAPPGPAAPQTLPPAAGVEGAIPAVPAPAPADIPDWLEESAPGTPTPETAPAPSTPFAGAPPSGASGVPEWLQELATAEGAQAPIAPTERAAAAPAPIAETTAGVPPTAQAELPDWLQELVPAQQAVEMPPTPETAPEESPLGMPIPAAADLPDWLAELAPTEPVAGTPGEIAPPEATPTPASPFVGAPPADVSEAPKWLREMAPAVSAEGEQPLAVEGLARAEIPDWLEALRPSLEAGEPAFEGGPVETAGLLQGLRGVLAPAVVTEAACVPESLPSAEASETTLARAQLLQSLLTQPASAPQPEPRRRSLSIGERIQRWIVAAVLLVPMVGAPLFELQLAQPVDSTRADGLREAIEGVDPGETVLVAFEYGPAEAGELGLIGGAVLRHLVERGAQIRAVSSRPEGLMVAHTLQSSVASQEPSAPEYVGARYLPGGASGIAGLLADAEAHYSLIVVLASDSGRLRWWVEQVEALGSAAPPLVAGVSAAVEPVISAYADPGAGQIAGVISGLSAAAAYEASRGLEAQSIPQINTLAAGHLAVIALMLGSVVLFILGRPRRRARE